MDMKDLENRPGADIYLYICLIWLKISVLESIGDYSLSICMFLIVRLQAAVSSSPVFTTGVLSDTLCT